MGARIDGNGRPREYSRQQESEERASRNHAERYKPKVFRHAAAAPRQVDNVVLMSVVGGVLGAAVQRDIADRALPGGFVPISGITPPFFYFLSKGVSPTVHKKRVKHQQQVRDFRVRLDVLC